MDFLAKLKNIVRFARVSGPSENKQFPVQQMEYKGKIVDAYQIFPYGFFANVDDDALGVLFSIDGNSSNRAAISSNIEDRPELKQGEVSLYHPRSGTLIKLSDSGDIEIECTGELMVSAQGNVEIESGGDVEVNASGDVNVTANNVNIDATTTNLGVGGQPIARVGDTVTIPVTSSPGSPSTGQITTGGSNSSI